MTDMQKRIVLTVLLSVVLIQRSQGCTYNATHCTCEQSSSESICLRYNSGAGSSVQCRADTCKTGGYTCDCLGTELCSVYPCGVWRSTSSMRTHLGDVVPCQYHSSSSMDYANCVNLPSLLPASTPSPSPVPPVARCPSGLTHLSLQDILSGQASQADPQVTGIALGATMSAYVQGMNDCDVDRIRTGLPPQPSLPEDFTISTMEGGTSGQCASIPSSSTLYENYMVTVVESQGFLFRPGFEVYDIDYMSPLARSEESPRENVAVFGFYQGQLVLPSLQTTAGSGTTSLQGASFTFPASGMGGIGETGGGGDLTVNGYQAKLNVAPCGPNDKDRCGLLVQFNEAIEKMVLVTAATYNLPPNTLGGSRLAVTKMSLC